MTTRSRTRSAAAQPPTKAVSPTASKASGIVKREASLDHDLSGNRTSVKGASTRMTQKSSRGKNTPTSDLPCTCNRGDDGSPMVLCSECSKWHHFVCLDLSERDAEDIARFICPSCSKTTGLSTTKSWEGPDAFQDEEVAQRKPRQPYVKSGTKTPAKHISDLSGGSEESEDDYRAEEDDGPIKDRSKSSRKRRVAAKSPDSGSDSNRHKRPRRLTKASVSPAPVKRKASTSDGRSHAKKQKGTGHSPEDDPTRKYCLAKLEEMFHEIFFRHPHVRRDADIVPKAVDEMTDEEKETLLQESKSFAAELEQCTFDEFAEVDKSGQPAPGIKYKDRFRTLQFNLSKPDRVFIHRRITSASISAKELSGMSSTELANEETQQEIKQAEQEALEHSILQKVVAPRAKITHKGLQDIEYTDASLPMAPPSIDSQAMKEKEAEERRERERLARLKPVQRQRTMSISQTSESTSVPPTPTTDSWGAPPPVPVRDEPPSPSIQRGLFIRTGSDITGGDLVEPELNLADFINIDEVSPSTEVPPTPPMHLDQQHPVYDVSTDPFSRGSSSSAPTTDFHPTPSPTTGVFPFAHPSTSHKQSFSLNTLWNESKANDQDEDDQAQHPVSTTPPPLSPPTIQDDEFGEDDMVESPIERADDQDFDMFLEDKEPPTKAPEAPRHPPSVEYLPEVWRGKVSMPLDSSIPQETPMVARQIAGTPIPAQSLLWKTLFPSDLLRVDGRVPVDGSAKYITQMRMTTAKELYAVALVPSTEADEGPFRALSDFLNKKGRHGLVFPWGTRPKEHHPGRELYLIPIAASEPLPEYIELLDDLRLSKDRTRDYMIGIWILNKGKLAPPPVPPAVAPSPTHPGLGHHPAPHTPPVPSTFTPPRPTIPAVAPTPPSVPPLAPQIQAPSATHVTHIDPAALAAEVATLTPEQIQNVLRTLQLTTPSAPGAIPGPSGVPAVPSAAGHPGATHYGPPSAQNHVYTWPSAAPPAHPQYPHHAYPPYGGSSPPPPSASQGHHEHPRGHYDDDRYDRGQHIRGGRGRNRNSRGSSRGVGGGGGGPRGEGGSNRPSDSGWPRRPKNASHPHGSYGSYDSYGSYGSDRQW